MKWPAPTKPWAPSEMAKSAGHFTIKKLYRLEGSAYGLSPAGPQKVYSRIVSPDSLLGGDGHHNRYWDQYFETGGELVNTMAGGHRELPVTMAMACDLEVTKFKNLTVELGYNRERPLRLWFRFHHVAL